MILKYFKLNLSKQKIPAEAEYRKSVEAMTNYRKQIIENNTDVYFISLTHFLDP